MRIEYVRADVVAKWPRNPKKHDKAGIRSSIRRFGFIDPLIEDATSGRLVAGHGRDEVLLEMREDGVEPPKRIRVDPSDGMWLVPVIRGISFTDEKEAEAYLLASNKLVEVGGYDESLLADLLRDHRDALDGTGFAPDEVDKMLTDLEDAASATAPGPVHAPNEFKEVSIDVKTDYCCPKCGYEWSGKQS